VSKVLPTSFSSLSKFETCPRQYYYQKITQEVQDPPGEAALWGSRVHEALEEYLRDGKELPNTVKMYQKYADQLKDRFPDGELLVEKELAVDANFQPCAWGDPNAWFRGIIDVAILHDGALYMFDWKTGRKKSDFDQLTLFAAMATSYYPEAQQIHAAYIWLKEKAVTRKSFTRDEARKAWADLSPRVKRLEEALEYDNWPARPSGLCKRWCAVGRLRCEHCGS